MSPFSAFLHLAHLQDSSRSRLQNKKRYCALWRVFLIKYILNFCSRQGYFYVFLQFNRQNFEYLINCIFRYTEKKHVRTKYVQIRKPEISGVLRIFLVYYVK